MPVTRGMRPRASVSWRRRVSALQPHLFSEIGDKELADVVDSLYDDDYAWYDERFLIEVTQLDEA